MWRDEEYSVRGIRMQEQYDEYGNFVSFERSAGMMPEPCDDLPDGHTRCPDCGLVNTSALERYYHVCGREL
jgi:hypothetical protein